MSKSVIVIPCYNEAARLRLDDFAALARAGALSLLFVNDGSTDGTGVLLDRYRQAAPALIDVLHLLANQGKAEAIRQGLLFALDKNATYVGFADADLATPASEIHRLLSILREGPESVHAVFGSRIRRLGAAITRHALRHYLGRTFATAVSFYLQIPIYDSQCGAKMFRASAALRAALETPFRSRWIFDVELIQRLLRQYQTLDGRPAERFLEVPLTEWQGVQGSKVRAMTFVRAGIDFVRMIGLSRQ